MPDEDFADDAGWNHAARHETETERLDRNWSSLLQELRVVETGVQLLTGLLLTLPFQARFEMLDEGTRTLYLATVACSLVSTALLAAPVAIHRMLFRRHQIDKLVSAAHHCAFAGLVLLGLAMAGVTTIVFYAVEGRTAGMIAGGVALAAFAVFWVGVPLLMRQGAPDVRPNGAGS